MDDTMQNLVLLRMEEAARRLALGRATLYEIVARGEIPVVRVGRAIRIPVAALDDWAQRHTTTNETKTG